MINKIMEFVNRIKGEKILKVAGIALIILGVFDLLGTFLLYGLFALAPQLWDVLPIPNSMFVHMLNFISPCVEIAAGLLASYFIRHREKYIFATILAMVLVLSATFTANLFPDMMSKILIYVSLIPAYLYLFGATKLRESVTYDKYDEYKMFYEKYGPLHQEDALAENKREVENQA